MLSRPGAPPGPALDGSPERNSLSGPDHSSPFMMPFWAFLLIYIAVGGSARRFGGLRIVKYAYDGNGGGYGVV